MWLQTKGSPYPTDRRVRIAACRCYRTDRPMRGIFWRRTQRALDHSGNLIIIDRARPARASFIQGALRCDPSETVDAICRPCAHECQARLQPTCSQSRRRTAGWPDSAPIMTAPPDGPGPAASDARSSLLRTKAALGRPTTLAITRPHHIDKSEAYNVMNFNSR